MDLKVVDVPERRRYEVVAADDGAVLGFADYRVADGVVTIPHVEVDPAYEGRGVGGTLVRGLLDDVRLRGLKVVPLCPFARAWIARNEEYADLVHRS